MFSCAFSEVYIWFLLVNLRGIIPHLLRIPPKENRVSLPIIYITITNRVVITTLDNTILSRVYLELIEVFP